MGVSHQDIEALRAGSAVGPYVLIAPIGEGGMARVWVARVRGKQELVAVKMLLPELAENDDFRKMFFDEANIASRVRHPNVCSTYELGHHAGTLYIAMEWVDGASLMRVLRPGREDLSECPRIPIRARVAARIVADVCAGLHAAHELRDDRGRLRDVVHRDVSPHNLLITQDGITKITDFGVAKALGKSHMTLAGQLKGKLAYMAPEQLVGGAIDRRCDVFALGCVLYEITVGQRPFQGEHDPQVMASIMLGRMDPPSALVGGYPPELEAVVMRALAHEPNDRYRSAEEMQRALEAYLRASGPPVTPAQITALVTERCRQDIEARARLMAEAGALGPRPGEAPAVVPRPLAASDSGSGSMAVERASSPSHRGVLWLALAALLGASLGVGVLSYVRSARRAKAAARTATTTTTTTLAAGSVAPTSPLPVIPGEAAGGDAPPAASAAQPVRKIRLNITPPNAVVVVDDVVMPMGTTAVARRSDGATMSILVRAEKHQDTVVIVDSATPDEVDVKLEPLAHGPRKTPAAAGSRDRGEKGDKGDPALETPPNPYE